MVKGLKLAVFQTFANFFFILGSIVTIINK